VLAEIPAELCVVSFRACFVIQFPVFSARRDFWIDVMQKCLSLLEFVRNDYGPAEEGNANSVLDKIKIWSR
jgi:hypothetical protein